MKGLQPPGLDRSLGTDERANVLTALLTVTAELEQLSICVRLPPDKWPATVVTRLRPPPGLHESSEQQLRRWWSLFADEIALVQQTRNRIVHQLRVSDAELLRAQWLGRHLLSLVETEPGG